MLTTRITARFLVDRRDGKETIMISSFCRFVSFVLFFNTKNQRERRRNCLSKQYITRVQNGHGSFWGYGSTLIGKECSLTAGAS